MNFSMILALAGLALTAPLQASEPQEGAATQEPAKPEKKICKRETSMGSNFSTKVCRTAAEWRAEYERDRKQAQDAKN